MDANKLIMELAEACKPIVQAIEAAPPVTKDRYDQYMVAIQRIADRLGDKGEDKTRARIAAIALIYAKGNRQGIAAALDVMGYGAKD